MVGVDSVVVFLEEKETVTTSLWWGRGRRLRLRIWGKGGGVAVVDVIVGEEGVVVDRCVWEGDVDAAVQGYRGGNEGTVGVRVDWGGGGLGMR